MSVSYAVSVSEAEKQQLDTAVKALQLDEESKGRTIIRALSLLAENQDLSKVRDSGTDGTALQAAFDTIRSLFVACVDGRTAVVAEMQREIAELKAARAKESALYQERLADYEKLAAEKVAAEERAIAAEKRAEQLADQLKNVQTDMSAIRDLVQQIALSKAAESHTPHTLF